jgi:hypothetical protein
MKKITIIFLLFNITIISNAQTNQLLLIKSNLLVNTDIENSTLLNDSFEKKSPGIAILYSMLLPGMGQLYADDYSTGKYFTIADGIFWSVFSGITIYGKNKESDSRAYAVANAGINLHGKDDAYFANISSYENIDRYNTEQELSREFDAVYDPETHYWSWESESQRKIYRGLWSSSENAKNNVRFAVGALILNRVVSAIFAVRSVNAYNKKQTNELGWNLNFDGNANPNSLANFTINFQKSF